MPGVQACGRKEGSVRELVWYLWFIINCWHSSLCRSQDPACAKQRLNVVLGNVLTRKRAFPGLSDQAEVVSPSCVMGITIKRWLIKCTVGPCCNRNWASVWSWTLHSKPRKQAFPSPEVWRITVFKDLPLNGKILAHNYAVFSLPKHIHEL